MFSHLRRRIGVLTAVAVLAALVPVLNTSPASAAASATLVTAVSDPATYLACPSGSAPAAGFTDTTSTDVDCIAMYGITTGVTATTYEPTASVPRWQMALYLTRMAGPTQVTLGTGADQGFTDISGYSAEIQTAINQIKQLGVTVGKTATTFAPADNVTREEMALFVQRLLHVTPTGPGGESDSALTLNVDGDGGTYNYTDIDSGSVTVAGNDAIIELWNLGIHDGLLATTYNPSADMTRAAMATFLTAALNHTNARPAGLVFQTDLATKSGNWTAAASITHRNADFSVIVGTPVDVMVWSPTGGEGDAAFLSTGLCDDAVTAGSLTKCYIDAGELVTDDKGNVAPTLVASGPSGTTTTSEVYYAWSAAVGTTFDNDLHGEGVRATDDLFASTTVTATAAASETRCTMDAPANTAVTTAAHTAKYGATLTITCQVKDGTGSAPGDVALAGRVITMNVSREFDVDSVGTQDGDIVMSTNTVGTTDATGLVTFTVAGPADPSTTTDSHIDTIVLTCADNCNAGTATTGNSGFMSEAANTILTHTQVYLDTTPDAASTVVTSSASSGVISATTGISRLVTATVYDQYGDTVAGETVNFTADQDLPGGVSCTAIAASECTALVAHGLSDGDELKMVEDTNYHAIASTTVLEGKASDVLAVADLACVGTVGSTTTFLLEGIVAGSTTDYGCGTAFEADTDGVASTSAAPAFFVQTNPDGFTAAVSRVTSSAGTASYSWSDKHSVSGKIVVSAVGASGTPGTNTFYRLDAAADFTEAGDNNSTLANGETLAKLVEWDAVGQDYIILKAVAAAATDPIITYQQYSYDANDHFVTGATVTEGSGTATTMALWIAAMTTNAGTVGGTYGDVALVDYEALSTGISQHSDG